jgi:MFS family permease
VRNFRLWFIGQGVSQIGYFAQTIALAVLTLQLTDDGTAVGIVTSIYFLPVLAFGPWAGVLSDRVDKRKVLLGTQTAMMAFAFVLGIFALAGWATYASTVIIAALNGIAGAFDQPPRRTIVTELVDEADGANAVALNTALNQAAKVVGPAIAGVLVSTVGVGWCFMVNGISSIAVLGGLLLMDGRAIRVPTVVARTKGQIVDGFRYAWAHADVRLLLTVLGFSAALSFNWTVTLPLFVERDLHDPTSTFALLMTAMSIGCLISVVRIARYDTIGMPLIAASSVAFGVLSIGMAFTSNVYVGAVVMLVVGVLSQVLFTGGIVALQLAPPPEMRGRIMAIFSMVVLGAYAVGGMSAGWLAEQFGARPAIAFSGVSAVVIGATMAAVRVKPKPVPQPATT